jgi:hypothetical protein
MTDPTKDAPQEGTHPLHTVVVHVNSRPVTVPAPTTTGLQIKEAAILAGLSIQRDFVLSEEEPNGHTRIIGDQEPVHVNDQSKFLAIAPDDNS